MKIKLTNKNVNYFKQHLGLVSLSTNYLNCEINFAFFKYCTIRIFSYVVFKIFFPTETCLVLLGINIKWEEMLSVEESFWASAPQMRKSSSSSTISSLVELTLGNYCLHGVQNGKRGNLGWWTESQSGFNYNFPCLTGCLRLLPELCFNLIFHPKN